MSPPIRRLAVLAALLLATPVGIASDARSIGTQPRAHVLTPSSIEPPQLAWSHADLRDPHSYFDATMQLLRPQLPGLVTSNDAATAQAATASTSAPARYPFPAGDLRGRGEMDLFVIDYVFDAVNYTIKLVGLEALQGATGTTLWTLPLDPDSEVGVASIPDVDGGGGQDVLLFTYRVDGTSPDCPFGIVAPPDPTGTLNTDWYCSTTTMYHWALAILDGASGAPKWTRTWTGQEGYTPLGFPYATNASVYAAPLVPTPGAAPLLVLDWFDAAGEYIPEYSPTSGLVTNPVQVHDDIQANLLQFNSTAQLVRAANGAPVSTQALPQSTTEALLVPGPTLQEGQGSLVWLNFTYPTGAAACANLAEGPTPLTPWTCAGPGASAEASLLDAATMQVIWRTSFPTDAAWLGTFGDLDGDGVEDLLVFELPLTEPTAWDAISGATGAHLWVKPIQTEFLMPVGNVDEGPGVDVASFTSDFSQANMIGLNVTRIDGATGTRLFSTTTTAPEGCDGTGYSLDTAPNALPGGESAILLSFAASCHGNRTTTLHAESATDGHLVLQETGLTGSAILAANLPNTCACGPTAYEYDWHNGTGTIHAWDLARTTILWNRASPGAYLLPDLDADGAPDLVEPHYDPTQGTMLIALAGPTGEPIWTSPPP